MNYGCGEDGRALKEANASQPHTPAAPSVPSRPDRNRSFRCLHHSP